VIWRDGGREQGVRVGGEREAIEGGGVDKDVKERRRRAEGKRARRYVAERRRKV